MRLVDEDSADDLMFVPGTRGMNVPTACTIVIIAGSRLTHNTDTNIFKRYFN